VANLDVPGQKEYLEHLLNGLKGAMETSDVPAVLLYTFVGCLFLPQESKTTLLEPSVHKLFAVSNIMPGCDQTL
jgi:hypothetical protein